MNAPLQPQPQPNPGMRMRVLYKNPSDFPDQYVVRDHWVSILEGKTYVSVLPAMIASLNEEGLDMIQTVLKTDHMTWLERRPEDDPCIVGCWI